MPYSEADLRAAASAGVIDAADLARLLAFLSKASPADAEPPGEKFDVAHLLWYAGELIVMTAMGLYTTLAFSQMGGRALIACAVVYAIALTWSGNYLWHRKNLRVPGGLLIAIAVSMAPLAVYGVQTELGAWGEFGNPGTVHDFYEWVKGSFIFMEIATVIAGVVALRFYRFPFIVAIIAVALWFMSMDLAPWIAGTNEIDGEMRREVSVWFGLAMLAVAWVVDYRSRSSDFAFWLHLFGLTAFWAASPQPKGRPKSAKPSIVCSISACCSWP